jgi:hypothetical protein
VIPKGPAKRTRKRRKTSRFDKHPIPGCLHPGTRCWWFDPPGQEARLIELHQQGHTAKEIAKLLTEEFVHPRTEYAVQIKASALGYSLERKGLALDEVARVLACGPRTLQRWIEGGKRLPPLLKATIKTYKHGDRVWRRTWVDPDELERFIRDNPWLPNYPKMPPSRWKDLTSVLTRNGTRYIPLLSPQVFSYIGLRHEGAIFAACARAGVARHMAGARTGTHRVSIIDAGDLPKLRDEVERFTTLRREQSKKTIMYARSFQRGLQPKEEAA